MNIHILLGLYFSISVCLSEEKVICYQLELGKQLS